MYIMGEAPQRLFIARKCPSTVIMCPCMNAHMCAYVEGMQWMHMVSVQDQTL